ncbi:LysR family transcriptional regulator ArgP [Pseudobacteriovorax antillogorgiicola]|uniref:LysR family transcriptional regulator, chromosome initiation inhibitor n=1 Tax=Pseudobacteriovorax antillogorgiicola TaxID=1513793 RepID=A0A1Y6BCU8_9BACT|nr:LysR family transcriptional regulator ArgP [Pseudobacteriovorax antillogorgiicola]TCS57309.1 LysR family transcriptional regulator (chromosome initiation inhibitor) [Pseudobacteriovorax antillogorgiicola]SMF02667.1 LysR family transcriptional regulator, chromosome initiation inhibitor [Pseudobacteriovorax antillogorgiicola]
MYDYKLLAAMASVIHKGGFDHAAKHLHITQSAVSQRVRQLEEDVGRPLLIRSSPPTPTELGRLLMAHFMKVNLLESELKEQIDPKGPRAFTHLSVAINRDSLALWFIEAMGQFLQDENIVLEVLAEDQELTHEHLKAGRVFGCVSARHTPLQGCQVEKLGTMTFYLTATPDFADKWFTKGVGQKSLLKAPGVIFDDKDHMLHDFLAKKFRITLETPPLHVIPALAEYERFITAGLGYGLLAKSQVEEKFADGSLVDLAPGRNLPLDLYWHSWQLQSEVGAKFTKTLLKHAPPLLR